MSIDAPRAGLRSDYDAYHACGNKPLAMVMISSATYPTLTGSLPAVMSPGTYSRELPRALGAPPRTTISDDLQSGAIARQSSPARHAINAGLDLLMYARTEQGSADAYSTLLAEARSGVVHLERVRVADLAITALKQLVPR